MFGIPSLQKLLVLAAIISAVWYGFKLLSQYQQRRDAGTKAAKRRAGGPKSSDQGAPKQTADAEDMVQCPACEAFVPARATRACGRADCPY